MNQEQKEQNKEEERSWHGMINREFLEGERKKRKEQKRSTRDIQREYM